MLRVFLRKVLIKVFRFLAVIISLLGKRRVATSNLILITGISEFFGQVNLHKDINSRKHFVACCFLADLC